MARARVTDTNAVIEAAARVFREKGYQNTTIDDIAAAAGIAKPTVYRYAKSKRWLLDKIVETVITGLERRVELVLADAPSPEERLRRLIRVHVEAATEQRTFYAILLSEETELSPRTRKRFTVWAREVTEDFRRMLDACAHGPDSAQGGAVGRVQPDADADGALS
jgi:AcrR family transcriptional regulator